MIIEYYVIILSFCSEMSVLLMKEFGVKPTESYLYVM